MSGVEIEDIEIDQPSQLSERQLNNLVALWRLSHYRQAPWSTWSILYSKRRRQKRSVPPMLCFDTKAYEILKEQQEEDTKVKQMHQHHIWQHVQDRLAEQNKILEEEKKLLKKLKTKEQQEEKANDLSSTSSSSSSTVTSGSSSPELNPTKRSIRWGLQNNMTKRFDKTSPITLVKVPAIDKLPTKSALKVRTAHTIQKQQISKKTKTTSSPSSTKTTTTTSTTTTTTTTNITNTANNTVNNAKSNAKNNFPQRKRAADFF